MARSILDISNLSVIFNTDAGRTEAVRNLSLSIGKGEILAVVGESGCGKSVLCKTIMGLLPHRAEIASGSIRLCGRELSGLSDREFCDIRGADISMVFQDPMTSLDPACRIGAQIAEAIRIHNVGIGFWRGAAVVIVLVALAVYLVIPELKKRGILK